MLYLFLYVLHRYELVAISIVIFVMFLLQVFTQLRLHKSLLNAVILLTLSFTIIIGWQIYRHSLDEHYRLYASSAAIAVWFWSALFMARHCYGLLKLA